MVMDNNTAGVLTFLLTVVLLLGATYSISKD